MKRTTGIAVCFLVGLLGEALAATQQDYDDCNQTGDLDRNIAACARVIGDQTESIADRATAYIHRGNAYMVGGKLDEAIADYGAAIQLDPKSLLAHAARAIAYWRKTDRDQAVADYTRAVDIDTAALREMASANLELKAIGDVAAERGQQPAVNAPPSADVADGQATKPAPASAPGPVTLTGHGDGVRSVAFSPDGRMLASGSADQTIKLWDATSGQLLRTLADHLGPVYVVAFSPDGRMLASGSGEKIKLWDVTTGQLLRTLAGHSGGIYSAAFSPDGRTLASGGEDEAIKLWDLTSGRLLRTLNAHDDRVYAIAFSADGRTLVSCTSERNVIRLWDVPSGRLRQKLDAHEEATFGCQSLAFSPDGRTFAKGPQWGDSMIEVWDATTWKLQRKFADDGGSVAFSPDGRTLASGTIEKIKLWDVTTGQLVRTLAGHSGLIHSVAFSPDGRTLASGGEDKTIKFWDLGNAR